MPNRSAEADPAAIRTLAGELTDQAWALDGALPAFSAAALGVNDAFGWLGPSADLLRDYLQVATDAIGAVGDLVEALGSAAGNLEVTATNYEQADAASTFAP